VLCLLAVQVALVVAMLLFLEARHRRAKVVGLSSSVVAPVRSRAAVMFVSLLPLRPRADCSQFPRALRRQVRVRFPSRPVLLLVGMVVPFRFSLGPVTVALVRLPRRLLATRWLVTVALSLLPQGRVLWVVLLTCKARLRSSRRIPPTLLLQAMPT
jgi:hypothetical protein